MAQFFGDLSRGLAPRYFRSNYIQGTWLCRSARFRSGRSLLSAAVEAYGERVPTRPLDVLFPRDGNSLRGPLRKSPAWMLIARCCI